MSLLPISRSRIAVIAAFSSALFKIVDPGQILSAHASQITKNEQCRHGRRDRTIVFGALAEGGTRLMRQYERFDGPTFVRYLKEVRRKWDKVLLVTDNASQHKHREVRKYLEEHDGLEILYLLTATPKLSAVESVWKDAKYRLVTSEHYETLEDLTHAVSEYFRTCSIRLDIYKFLCCCV